MNKSYIFAAVLIFTADVSSAAGPFDRVLGLFQPAKEFAGISLNSSLKDIKQLSFSCEDGTDAHNGKVFKFTDCKDENYKADIFGLNVSKRTVLFVDGKLAVVKVFKSAYPGSFEALKKKLDTVYPRITLSKELPDQVRWNFGGDAILIAAPGGINVLTPTGKTLLIN